MSQDHIYDPRWDFRRKDSDLDSSSDEKGSNSARNRKLQKSNQLLSLVQAENENQEEEISHKPELNPPKRAKNQPNSVKRTRNQKPKKNTKKPEGGTKKSGYEYNLATAIQGLEKHVNVLVKELNTSREGLSKWMEDELKKLVPESSNASPSKPIRKGKRQITKKRGESESGKKATPSKTINANGSDRVTLEQHKPTLEAPNLCKTSTVRNSGMVSTENPSMGFLASNYLNNLPNLNPRPLAENYLVKANSSSLRIEPVVLNSGRDQLNVQQQSAGYYQGMSLQSERDFDRSVMSASLSSSMGSYGGFPSAASHLGFKGAFNIHNLGLTGSEFLATENNFSSLSNNHLKYSS